MYKIYRTEEFNVWLEGLTNPTARKKIEARLTRASLGNFGFSKRLNEFLWEMKDTSPSGFRVYYTLIGDVACFIVLGGFKKTQSDDIAYATEKAKQLQEDYKNELH